MKEKGIENLSVFVVSSSQLGAQEQHVVNAMKVVNGPRAFHFWDGNQRVGASLQGLIEDLDEPAWDCWLLDRPGVTWGNAAPEPDWWEHELGALAKLLADRELDAGRFATKAAEIAERELGDGN